MKVSILRPVRPGWTVNEGPYYRMGRSTLTVPGYQTIRQWVLVNCDKNGCVTHNTNNPTIPLDILVDGQPANQPAMERRLCETTHFVVWDSIEA